MEILDGMAQKWPEQFNEVKSSAPLWKDGMDVLDPAWGDFAATAMGWLDQSASAMVEAGKRLSGEDPLAGYRQVATQLEGLLEEIAGNSKASRSSLETWFRPRSVQEAPAARLEKIIQAKQSLDQGAGGRMRYLRSAIEMRGQAREALAILEGQIDPFREHLKSRVATEHLKHEEAASAGNMGLALSRQRAEKTQRNFRRASLSLDVIAERLGHEFSGSSSDLSSLDDAVDQEEKMHARIEGLSGKVAALIAGGDLQKIAQDSASQSMVIAAKSKQAAPEASRGNFMTRMLGISSSPSPSKQSSRLIKELEFILSGKSRPVHPRPMLVRSEAELFEKFSALITDPVISPLKEIAGKPLLSWMIECASYPGNESSPRMPDWFRLIRRTALDHQDGQAALLSAGDHRLNPLIRLALVELSRGQRPAGEGGDPFEIPRIALSLWNRFGDTGLLRENARMEVFKDFLLDNPSRKNQAVPIDIKEGIARLVDSEITPDAPLAASSEKVAVVEALTKDLDQKNVDLFHLSMTLSGLRNKNDDRVRRHIGKIDAKGANRLAEFLWEKRRDMLTKWAPLLLSLHGDAAKVAYEDEKASSAGHFPFLVLDGSQRQEKKADVFYLNLLREYHDAVLGDKKIGQWPQELTKWAFQRKDLDLLNELAQRQPGALIPPLGNHQVNPLSVLIETDFLKSGKKVLFTSKTDPQFWCEKLRAFMPPAINASEQSGNLAPELPSITPLMLACQFRGTQWIKALVDRGADRAPKNESGLTAMDLWLRAMSKGSGREKGKSEWKWNLSKMSLAPRILEEMDAVGYWDLPAAAKFLDPDPAFKKTLAHSALLFHVEKKETTSENRLDGITALLTEITAEEYLGAVVGLVKPRGPIAPGDPELANLMSLGIRAGHFTAEDVQDKMDTLDERIKESALNYEAELQEKTIRKQKQLADEHLMRFKKMAELYEMKEMFFKKPRF